MMGVHSCDRSLRPLRKSLHSLRLNKNDDRRDTVEVSDTTMLP